MTVILRHENVGQGGSPDTFPRNINAGNNLSFVSAGDKFCENDLTITYTGLLTGQQDCIDTVSYTDRHVYQNSFCYRPTL